ncbi:MAG TPA: TonB family protein [Holophagaceae bacterium]|nr:TonB family protein [Holophagaceae bacterium]
MRTTLLASSLLLGAVACSKPEPQPALEKAQDAGRLVLDLRDLPPPFQAMGDAGTVVVQLKIRADGTVGDARKTAGSNQVWFDSRDFVSKLRFKPKDPSDHGPWSVTIAFVASSSGGGGMLEARATGSSNSSSSFRTEILDVKTAPK